MTLFVIFVCTSGYIVWSDVSRRYISNITVIIIAILSLILTADNPPSLVFYGIAVIVGVGLFAAGIFAGGDIKLFLAYLLGVKIEWWPAIMMIITGIGGAMALAYLLYGYLTNNMKAVRQKGLPYGVPIAIGGCLGILLSTT